MGKQNDFAPDVTTASGSDNFRWIQTLADDQGLKGKNNVSTSRSIARSCTCLYHGQNMQVYIKVKTCRHVPTSPSYLQYSRYITKTSSFNVKVGARVRA